MDANHLYAVALRFYEQGRHTESSDLAGRGCQQYPDFGPLWQLYGLACWSIEDYPAATHAFESASVLIPLSTAAQLALGDCYQRAVKPELALSIYQYLARSPRTEESMLPFVAKSLHSVGDYQRELRVWRRLVRRYRGFAEGYYRIALCLWVLEADPERLLSPLNEACQLEPENVHYHLTLANVWVELDDPEEAARVLTDLNPKKICCGDCLRRVIGVLRQLDQPELVHAFAARLEELLAGGVPE